jgi:hypothetical protein
MKFKQSVAGSVLVFFMLGSFVMSLMTDEVSAFEKMEFTPAFPMPEPPVQALSAYFQEDWIGDPAMYEWSGGLLSGLGEHDGAIGWSSRASLGWLIKYDGLIPEINDQLVGEIGLGPLVFEDGVGLSYTLHVRWDFHKDANWTFYSLGGLGGRITPEALGNAWRLYPRLGVGAFFKLTSDWWIRAELSHDFLAVGATFQL